MPERLSGLAASVLLALALAAPAAVADEPVPVKLLTGPQDGTYYRMATLLEERARDVLDLAAVSSDGSLGNLLMTSIGRADACMAQADALLFLRSQPAYEPAMRSIVCLLPLHYEEVHIVVRKGAGIAGLKDLAGKRLNIGIGASGSSVTAIVLLEALGIAEGEVELSQLANDDAVAALREGRLDAMIATGGAPLELLAALPLAARLELELLDIDPETAATLTGDMPYWDARIPAGTYPWQAREARTVATLCLLVSHRGAPEARAQALTEAVLANADGLRAGHRKWGEVSRKLADELLADGSLEFHPGAVKALKR